MKRALLFLLWLAQLVVAKIARLLGCYLVREKGLHEVVLLLDTIRQTKHKHPVGRRAAQRIAEDDYIAYTLAVLRSATVPTRWRR